MQPLTLLGIAFLGIGLTALLAAFLYGHEQTIKERPLFGLPTWLLFLLLGVILLLMAGYGS
ncbi:hypothetical protein MF271_06360 [Deinococcus sp. KNUC1210]|uniref:hypothetical protein n=1 Tax=Deinococcus sp. KNUC1210 TaxID=2917691 RepID=UPI001EF03F84|nr:hypothetical protein [Deinococcus sp. KNUC1210]ULH16228.1 hypothetical protein MF271_06360 [Deinococcus sp. KNUC1210]